MPVITPVIRAQKAEAGYHRQKASGAYTVGLSLAWIT